MYNFSSFSVEAKRQILIRPQPLKLPKAGLLLVVGANGVGKTTFLKQVGNSLLEINKELKISFISSIQIYEKRIQLSGDEFYKLFSAQPWPSELLDQFGHLLKKRIDRMSSGEFQALVLISNLLEESNILLIDEPISHLSTEWSLFFVEWMKELKTKKLLIAASHQIDLLSEASDQIFEIKNQSLSPKFNISPEVWHEPI